MERYLLFGGDVFYASGGFHDFLGDYATVPLACEAAYRPSTWRLWQQYVDGFDAEGYMWWHVVDTHTGHILWRSAQTPYGAQSTGEVGPVLEES